MFSYTRTSGDFIAQVRVCSYDNPEYHDKGLMARVADLSAAGPGEDLVELRHFDQFDVGNQVTDTNGNVDRWIGRKLGKSRNFLQLERIGNTFYFRVKHNENDLWVDLPDTPITRNDMEGLPLQVGICQSTSGNNTGTAQFDDFILQMKSDTRNANTASVDGTGGRPNTYSTIAEAYDALNRNDGAADTINITVDTSLEGQLIPISGKDALTINGDADGNGRSSTIAVAGDHPAFDLGMISSASYLLKDLIIIPRFDDGDKECEAIRYTPCDNLTNSTATLQNLVITSSSNGDAVVIPGSPYDFTNSQWEHAFQTAPWLSVVNTNDNTVNIVNSQLGQTKRECIHSEHFGCEGTTFNVVGSEILEGRSCGIYFTIPTARVDLVLENSRVSGFSVSGIAFEGGAKTSSLRLKRTLVENCCTGISFGGNGDASLLEIQEGCRFTGMYGFSCVGFASLRPDEKPRLRIGGTDAEPVIFHKNGPRTAASTIAITAEKRAPYQVEIENALIVENSGRGIEFVGEAGPGTMVDIKKVLLAGNALANVRFFRCEGLNATFSRCTMYNDSGANQDNSGGPGNNELTYTDCIFSGKPTTGGANGVSHEQTALKINYVNCDLVTEGPDGMSGEYSDYAQVATITKTNCIDADPIYQNVDLESLKNGSFNVRNPALAGLASDSGVLTGWGNAELLAGAGKENRPPSFLNDTITKRDALLGRPYYQFLIGDAYDADDYDQPYLVFGKVSGSKWLNVAADGLLSGTPEESDLGSNKFTVRVKDRLGETDEATLRIEVVKEGSVVNYSSAVSPAWVEEPVSADTESIVASLIDGTTAPLVRESLTRFYVDNASGTVGTDVTGATAAVSLGLLLDPKNATELEIATTTGAGTSEKIIHSITWAPTDLFERNPETDAIAIRRGDSLLLTGSGNGSVLEIDADGDEKLETVGSPGDLFPIFYAKAGAYIAAARIDGEPVGGIKILVQDADLDDPIACEMNYRREKEVSSFLAEKGSQVVFVAADPAALEVEAKTWFADVPTLYVKPPATGTPLLQVRLGHKGGPVIAEEKVDVFTVDLSGLTSVPILAHYPDGSSLLGLRLVMKPLIRDLDIQIHCFGTGATLEDLSTNRNAGTNDFTENGEYEFGLVTTGQGVCHWIRFCQRGVQISRSY